MQTLLSQDHYKRQAELSEGRGGLSNESLNIAGQSLEPSVIPHEMQVGN